MYASISHFAGDPGDLLRRYDAMIAEVPAANMRLHLCLRTDDGITIVDTCPSHEAYQAFAAGPFLELRRRYGLPDPTAVDDHPLHRAFVEGRTAPA